jgi:hypothetical protein
MTPSQKFSDPTLTIVGGSNFKPFFIYGHHLTRIAFG